MSKVYKPDSMKWEASDSALKGASELYGVTHWVEFPAFGPTLEDKE